MSRLAVTFLAVAVVAVGTAPRAVAIDLGLGLFKKKTKAEPPTRVKQLVSTLQSDPDEKKRLTAAEELRSFDPRNNPEMVPVLIGSLQQDPSPAVRAEAAETLGRLKPVEQPAGLALEAAQEGDPAAAVREAAKSALWQYHLNGYRAPTTVVGDRPQTAEPPLSTTKPRTNVASRSKPAAAAAEPGSRPIPNSVGRVSQFNQTTEPPLAKMLTGAKPAADPTPATTTVVLPTPQPSVAVPDVKPQPSSLAPPAFPTPMPTTAPTLGLPSVTAPPVPTITPPPTFTLPPQ